MSTPLSRQLRQRHRRLIGAAVTAFMVGAAVLVAAGPAQALVPTSPDAGTWGTDGRVKAILQTPSATYIGGTFTQVVSPSGQTMARTNIAAFNPTTGAPLAFAPSANKLVSSLAISPDGSTLYIGGQFTKVGTTNRSRIAAVNPTTGAVLPFNPSADAEVESIVATAGRVYLGGDFTTIGGQPHMGIAAVDTSGALQTGFTTTADEAVHSMTLTPDGSKLVVGGLFDALSSIPKSRRLDLVDPTSGAVTPFIEQVAYEVFGVTATSTQVFAAAAGGGGHTYAYNLATLHQQWLAISDGDVHQVAVQNGVLYVGGHFTMFSGQPASHMTAVSPTTGQQIGWLIKANSNLGIFAMNSFNGHLAIGGDFTKINLKDQEHFAVFSESLDTIPPTRPGPPSASATGPTTATVTWGASSDDQVANIVYNVYRDGGPTAVGQVTSSSTSTVSFADSGMVPGSTHTWTVQASDGTNLSPMSAVSNPVTLTDPGFPVVTSMSMLDNNTNGRVDQVALTFSAPVHCASPCLTPWTLASVPSNGKLQSVTVSGNTVDLNLKEGTAAMDTAVGGFTVALANDSVHGVLDASGDAARFSATAPADAAAPVPTDITSTNGATDNVMEDGDTFTATFSEPMDPSSIHAANVKEIDQNGLGNDELIIVGLTNGTMDLGSDDYVTQPGGTIVFSQSTLTLLPGGLKIRSTIVGPCSGTACGFTGAGANALVTFAPEPALTDLAGNHATGSHTETEGPY
jgi:hypothetical protein